MYMAEMNVATYKGLLIANHVYYILICKKNAGSYKAYWLKTSSSMPIAYSNSVAF